MNANLDSLAATLQQRFADQLLGCVTACGEVTIEVAPEHLLEVCRALRDEPTLRFEQLVDLCGVDYCLYGRDEWGTEEPTHTGFSRGVEEGSSGRLQFGDDLEAGSAEPRFAAVLHLLSYAHNRRLRVRCRAASNELPVIPSVCEIWNSANWYEREAFDLFGILFEGHADLRRLLTDYGFIGHPFRKDFPLIGQVEMRYDPTRRRVVYEPVSIEPRVLVPRVIRADNRYTRDPLDEEHPEDA